MTIDGGVMGTAIEALKIASVQNAEGWTVTIRIQPDEFDKAVPLLKVRVGSRIAFAFVEIDDDEQPVHPIMKAVEKKKKQDANVMRAGMACNEKGFQTFLKQSYQDQWKETVGHPVERATHTLRKVIDIDSRRRLRTDPKALARFDRLMAEFEMWKRGQ
jgi:hypothetical protein